MPYDEVRGVQVWGIDPESFDEVTGFAQTLHWTPEGSGTDWSEQDFRRDLSPELLIGLEEEGRALARVEADGTVRPGICLGLEISIGNKRNDEGTYDPINRWFMPVQEPVVLTTIPPDTLNTTPEPVSIAFAPVNEFSCGLILIDKERVFVPLAEARRMTNMTTAEEVDEEGLPTGKVFPARSSKILVRGNGLPEVQVRDIVDAAYREWAEREGHVLNPMIFRVQTWRENQASFLQPVENERELMRTLFSLVYLVCGWVGAGHLPCDRHRKDSRYWRVAGVGRDATRHCHDLCAIRCGDRHLGRDSWCAAGVGRGPQHRVDQPSHW